MHNYVENKSSAGDAVYDFGRLLNFGNEALFLNNYATGRGGAIY
ncbi:hypothetical protein H3V17_05520 [Bartonella sp. M0283]|nr:hypothetical protein [Bartonella sp. M0283]